MEEGQPAVRSLAEALEERVARADGWRDRVEVYLVTQEQLDELERRFGPGSRLHAGQYERAELIGAAAVRFARVILGACPESRERDLALEAIDLAVVRSSQAMGRNE